MPNNHFRDIDRKHLRLGLFSANCKGGLAISTAPGGWEPTWENNLALAKLADERGLDFHLPVARWLGTGHESGWMEESLDAMVWASAILASTKRLQVFATVHTAMHHPVAVAKACASASQVGSGRFGLNVVCGWNKPEYDMFGMDFHLDGVEKYAHGQEWLDIVTRLWRESEPFDHKGAQWDLKHVQGLPKPYGGDPVLINAAASPNGREFAVRNTDFLLTNFADINNATQIVKDIGELAATVGRHPGVIGVTTVVCRETKKEAEEFAQWYAEEHADWDCIDHNMKMLGMYGGNARDVLTDMFRHRFALGFGGFPLIGSPDDVAQGYADLQAAGYSGCTISMFDYLKGMPLFCDEVLPRLERLGVRMPVSTAQS